MNSLSKTKTSINNEEKTLQTNSEGQNHTIAKTPNDTEGRMRIKLDNGAIAPVLGTVGSAGYDLSVCSVEWLTDTKVKYNTGVAFEIPKGFVGLVFPRSSVVKTDLRFANCVGVIDSDYRGFVSAVFDYKEAFEGNPFREVYKVGERCCQIVFVPYWQVQRFDVVDRLEPTERGENGYGHTGK